MTAPRLTLFNGQRGFFAKTYNQMYISERDVEVTTTTTPFGTTVETEISIDTDTILYGVVFDVRPTVSADRRYVQLDLAPDLSTVTWAVAQYGTQEEPSEMPLPTEHRTSVRDTVSVPDGGTIVVGGIIYGEESKGEVGMPIFSKLPYIGWLFGRRADSYTLDNLLILITPHIILQPEEEDKVLKEAL
jgi:type II secretory pathway component GspD/PulD (secretin)